MLEWSGHRSFEILLWTWRLPKNFFCYERVHSPLSQLHSLQRVEFWWIGRPNNRSYVTRKSFSHRSMFDSAKSYEYACPSEGIRGSYIYYSSSGNHAFRSLHSVIIISMYKELCWSVSINIPVVHYTIQ